MDNKYLQDLIKETKERGGGLILDMDGKPEVVVLMIEKYNELMARVTSLDATSPQPSPQKESEGRGEKILVTGGAGYIGAHVVGELLDRGFGVVIIDNLSCGKRENLDARAKFYEGDLRDLNFLRDVFAQEKIDAVMHFAASIEVEESVREPEKYFENNVANTVNLLNAMKEAGVKNIIFSSTAAVYGEQDKTPISEIAAVRPNNPYGFSKLLAEKAIKFYCQFAGFNAIVFRYFNACGCRDKNIIIPTHSSHLIDNVMEVALGHMPQVKVFGNDFSTFDGSGVRDYVHVLDIAKAHVMALEHIMPDNNPSQAAFQVFNIGTGKGQSVLGIISQTSEILNKIIPMEVAPRRAGDAAETVADANKIFKAWGFKPEHSGLENIIKSAYKQKVETANTQMGNR